MYEATFRIEGGSAYAAATRGSDATIELWCNDHCDLLHVRNPDGADDSDGSYGADGADVLGHVRELVGIRERVREGDELLVVTDDCLEDHEDALVEPFLARHGCLLLPPLRYAGGAKHCRVLSLTGAALTGFYRDLAEHHDVTVESKREIRTPGRDAPLLTGDELLPALSPRQREVFALAHERGYYAIPRETTTEKLAAEIGVGRRTVEEHLRRAENKLADALVDHL